MKLIDLKNTVSGEVKYPVFLLWQSQFILHSNQHGQHAEKRLFAKQNKMLKRKLNRKI